MRSDTLWFSRRGTNRLGKEAAAELVAAGYDAHTVRLEVTDPDDISGLVSYIETTFGKLDVLVNNAGIALEWDGKPTDADKVHRTLEVNLIAPYAITEALIPLLSRSDDARVIKPLFNAGFNQQRRKRVESSCNIRDRRLLDLKGWA